MTIRHMRIFTEVYRTGNITKAAQALHMTQPAVSRAIQELEHYYKVRLFERLNHRLYITESGHRLYPQAKHLTDLLDSIEEELYNRDGGVLRVGATLTLGSHLLPQLVQRFADLHPGVQVRVQVASGAMLERALADNTLDLALMEGNVDQPHLHREPFSHDRLLPVFPPQHPLLGKAELRLADLAGEPLLMREPGSAGRTFLNHLFAVHDLPLAPVWESTSTGALLHAVAAGLGVAILPEQLVQQEIAAGRVSARCLVDEDFTRTHHLVWHENKYLTAPALDFLALARAAVSP